MNSGKLQAYASLAEVVSAVAIVLFLYAAYEFRRSELDKIPEHAVR